MKHQTLELLAYLHGELPEARLQEIERHVGDCAECRAELEELRTAQKGLEALPRENAPDELWARIEAAVDSAPVRKRSFVVKWLERHTNRMHVANRWGLAAGLAVLAMFVVWINLPREEVVDSRAWVAVSSDAGEPTIGSTVVGTGGRLRIGQELQTGSSDSATITMDDVGKVKVLPNSRLALLASSPGEQRFDLRSGSISAVISAPPKIFFVETKLATAVDLGCKYTLSVDDDGNGQLKVTEGWVELVGKNHKTLVRAGSACEITTARGPGVPFDSQAPAELVSAVKSCEGNKWAALPEVLATVQKRDALTLWHLLFRAPIEEREAIYQTLARLTPPPAGIEKGACLSLEESVLQKWREDFAPLSSYDFWKP